MEKSAGKDQETAENGRISKNIIGTVLYIIFKIPLHQESRDQLTQPVGGVHPKRTVTVPWRHPFGVGNNGLEGRGRYRDIDMNGKLILGRAGH